MNNSSDCDFIVRATPKRTEELGKGRTCVKKASISRFEAGRDKTQARAIAIGGLSRVERGAEGFEAQRR